MLTVNETVWLLLWYRQNANDWYDEEQRAMENQGERIGRLTSQPTLPIEDITDDELLAEGETGS